MVFINSHDSADSLNVAVIITTFNWPHALDQVLRTLVSQTRQPDIIVVADDGSHPPTAEVVKDWQAILPLQYVWQPDSGFRVSRVRNLAVAKLSRLDNYYGIMIDGDCLLPPNFIEMHVRLKSRGWMVAGSRFLLGANETSALLGSGPVQQTIGFAAFKFRYLPLGFFRRLRPRNWRIARTCNLSIWLSDFLHVGGFDEGFVGWGKEDSDLVVRLIRSGVGIINGRFAACVKHLHHKEMDRSGLDANLNRLEEARISKDYTLPKKSIFKASE